MVDTYAAGVARVLASGGWDPAVSPAQHDEFADELARLYGLEPVPEGP